MIYTLYVGATLILLTLGFTVAWARRGRWIRWGVIAATLVAMPAAYLGALDMLSRPKPEGKEFLLYRTQKAEVKGHHAIAGKGLYLLLYADDWPEPRYFSYPWNKQTREIIKQLQDASESAKRHGQPLFMYNPFEPSLENEEPIFEHPPPMPKPPPKDMYREKPPKKYRV